MLEVSAKPGSRRREQTRARLLDAAHEVFGEVGMAAASVEAICERAGFSRGAFYSNFESKEELFLALITQLSEDKLEQVAGRVRALASGSHVLDASAIVNQVVGVSVGDRMEPQLIAEIRVQALRDPRMAAAYLSWQDGLRMRVEQIIEQVVDAYGVRLRLPVPDAAQLMLDLSDDTCTRAAMEGRSRDEIGELLNARLERLVVVLVEAPAG